MLSFHNLYINPNSAIENTEIITDRFFMHAQGVFIVFGLCVRACFGVQN